jgi:hypothetical protein
MKGIFLDPKENFKIVSLLQFHPNPLTILVVVLYLFFFKREKLKITWMQNMFAKYCKSLLSNIV